MKILISGVCGFVGSSLARFFIEQDSEIEVAGFDNFIRAGSEQNRRALQALGVRVTHADLRAQSDIDALPAADWVIDAAANASVLAGAGQFGRADQGIFSFWINSWLRRRALQYIGFGGTGHQVRDCLHPRDLAALLLAQLRDPARKVSRLQNVAGGAANAMSLAQLSAWCAQRFGAHHVAAYPGERAFDIPWMVMDSARAARQWDWQPAVSLDSILTEIADHAEQHPDWLEVAG